MNPNQMTDAKLSLWLGEVLQPGDSWPHDIQQYGTEMICQKCGEQAYIGSIISMDRITEHSCKVNTIPLDDWNVAFKWRDWAVEEFDEVDYMDALWEIFCDLKGYDITCSITNEFSQWLGAEIKPRYSLIAAAKCKENRNAK